MNMKITWQEKFNFLSYSHRGNHTLIHILRKIGSFNYLLSENTPQQHALEVNEEYLIPRP